MRSKTRPAKPVYDSSKWHQWFAWYPVKVRTSEPENGLRAPYCWMWLENVERRLEGYYDVHYFVYRIKQ